MLKSLFHTISSLTQVEKREFKKFYSMKNRTQDYIRLFDLLNKLTKSQKVVEVLEMQNLIAEKLNKPPADLTRIKKALRDKLIDFRGRQSKDHVSQIYHLLSAANIFRKNKNFELAAFSLQKAKELGNKYEEFEALENALKIEQKLPNRYKTLNLERDKERVQEILASFSQLENFNERLKNWPKEKEIEFPKISLIQSVLEDGKNAISNEIPSVKAKAFALLIVRKAYTIKGQWLQAIHYSEKYLKLGSV